MKQGACKIIWALALCLTLAAPAKASDYTKAYEIWVYDGGVEALRDPDYMEYSSGKNGLAFQGAIKGAGEGMSERYGRLELRYGDLGLGTEHQVSWGQVYANYVRFQAALDSAADMRSFFILTAEIPQRCYEKEHGETIAIEDAAWWLLNGLAQAQGKEGYHQDIVFPWWAGYLFQSQFSCGGISPKNQQLFRAIALGDIEGALEVVRSVDYKITAGMTLHAFQALGREDEFWALVRGE